MSLTLTTAEAAEYLKVSQRKILKACQEGTIVAEKKGWMWLIHKEELERVRKALTK